MKPTSTPWQNVIRISGRMALIVTRNLLQTTGHLLQTSGAACTKLGELVDRKESTPRGPAGSHL